jgi:hypothetical protein
MNILLIYFISALMFSSLMIVVYTSCLRRFLNDIVKVK